MKLNRLHQIWFPKNQPYWCRWHNRCSAFTEWYRSFKKPTWSHMQGMLVIPSFRGGAGFSGPAHSVEQKIGCTADSCRAQHVAWCPQTPTMGNGKLGMGNGLCLFGDPAGVVLSWFSRLRENKSTFELEPNHYRDEIRMECVTSFPEPETDRLSPYKVHSHTNPLVSILKCITNRWSCRGVQVFPIYLGRRHLICFKFKPLVMAQHKQSTLW